MHNVGICDVLKARKLKIKKKKKEQKLKNTGIEFRIGFGALINELASTRAMTLKALTFSERNLP